MSSPIPISLCNSVGLAIPNDASIQVSVVIPCRNEIRFIGDLLNSVLLQDTGDLGVEILVADGGSDDGTRQILDEFEQKYPALRVIDNPAKIAATGLNIAIREARGKIIIRMDVHSDYAPDYVRTCIDTLNKTGADNVGGPALVHSSGYVSQAIAIAFHTAFANGGAKFHDSQFEGYVDTVPYGCWLKSTLDRMGLFDEAFVRNQDDELNLRIISKGGKIWQSPAIICWYWPRASFAALFSQYFQYGFWKVAVIRKHRRPASWRHLVPGVSLMLGMALIFGAVAERVEGSIDLSHCFLTVFEALAGLYAALSLGAALIAAARQGWRFLPILPVAFATSHVSYGLGFLMGIVCPCRSPGRPA
jgi:succinoglycan biosynthesis protein ExoA